MSDLTAHEGPSATSNGFGPGAVYRVDAGFAAAVAGYNSAAVMNPEVVVRATSARDIQQAVAHANGIGMRVAVQASGHGYVYPVTSGVLIDTSMMRGVDIDPLAGTATVQPGARWADVNGAADRYGLAGLNGSSSGVGVVGFCLGGGFPILGRAYGYGSDRIRSADLVTGDGQLHHVDAAGEPELFWALRGGKANVGIVTSMTVDLVNLHRLYGGGIYYPGAVAADVLREFADWAPRLPHEAGTSLALLRLPADPGVPEPLRGQFVMSLRFAYTGPAAEGAELLAPMRAVGPAIFDQVAEMPYVDVDRIHGDPPGPMPFTEGGVLLRDFPAAAVESLIEAVGPDSATTLLLVELRLMGGAFAVGPGSDAISGRGAGFFATMIAHLDDAGLPAARAEIDRVAAVLAPWSMGGAVNLNGPAATEAASGALWSPQSRAKLVALRMRHDPNGTIHSGHTV